MTIAIARSTVTGNGTDLTSQIVPRVKASPCGTSLHMRTLLPWASAPAIDGDAQGDCAHTSVPRLESAVASRDAPDRPDEGSSSRNPRGIQ